MVGGVVIEVAEVPDRPTILFVDCVERRSAGSKPQTCAIFVEKNENSLQIQIGDSLWWQGRLAMWTPYKIAQATAKLKQGVDFDVQIPRVGYSGVTHPSRKQLEQE